MKQKINIIIYIAVLTLFFACKKDDDKLQPTASIYVINTTIGLSAVKVNPGASSEFSYAKASNVSFGSSGVFGTYTGSKTIAIVNASDTSSVIFSKNIDLTSASILYLSGQAPNIDTMFTVANKLPYVTGPVANPDNSMYIRFENWSPNSTPLSINIRSSVTNEVSNLPYKGISDFKKYVALTTTANYIFEVRDANNTVRATFTLNTNNSRFKTVGLIIKGLLGTTTGTNAFGVFQVNYI